MQLSRWMKQGKVIGLRRGMSALAEMYRHAPLTPAALANQLYRPSYLSGLWALGHHDLIPERVVWLTSVTSRVLRRFENPFGVFDYRNIKLSRWHLRFPLVCAGDSVWCMTTKNPFPGMNPFFEQRWRDAHTMLIAYLRDALQERLPTDLVAGAEEEIVTVSAGERTTTYRPDVQVREPWTLKEPVAAAEAASAPRMAPATEPIRVFLEDETERWLEIHDTIGRLITVLELLSPSNKLEAEERDRYGRKCRDLIRGGVNLVEIDLVRKGACVFLKAIRDVLEHQGATYGVAVFRVARSSEREVYPIRLRDRLPVIRVPLRPTDADVVVDLQPLIDQCHERGRYHLLNYRLDLDPPLPPTEAVWVDQVLRDHDLR